MRLGQEGKGGEFLFVVVVVGVFVSSLSLSPTPPIPIPRSCFSFLPFHAPDLGLRVRPPLRIPGLHRHPAPGPLLAGRAAALVVGGKGVGKIYTLTKVDNGSGQPGNSHFKIDLEPGITAALGFTLNDSENIQVRRA